MQVVADGHEQRVAVPLERSLCLGVQGLRAPLAVLATDAVPSAVSPLERVEVRVPAASYGIGRWRCGWFGAMLVSGVLTALALRRPLGVEF